jgi:hypothetical protein
MLAEIYVISGNKSLVGEIEVFKILHYFFAHQMLSYKIQYLILNNNDDGQEEFKMARMKNYRRYI